MKTSFVIILFALLILGSGTTYAQTAESIKQTEQAIRNNGKYAILVMKAQHLKTAVKTGIDFRTKSSGTDFQIVACGELVKDISEDKELKDLIQKAVKNNGLKVVVCGLSVQQLKVDKNQLPVETPVTENGLQYLFGLQESGYNTIAL